MVWEEDGVVLFGGVAMSIGCVIWEEEACVDVVVVVE